MIEAIGGAGHPPSEVVCVGGGAKGRLLCELRAHVTGLPVCRPDDVETTARGAAMLAAAGAGLHPTVAAAARAMAGPRSAPRAARTRSCARVYDDLHRRHRRLYAALRPLFDGEASVARCPTAYSTPPRGGGRSRPRAPGSSTCSSSAGGSPASGAALDAATRGLRVALVEARDLAAGTSSASSKLIHGGLRYLEMGDIGLVREALRERELLLTRIAPHLVAPVPFLWPLRGRGWERAYLGAGLVLYDTHRRRAVGAAPPAPEPARRAGRRPGAAPRRARRRRAVPRRARRTTRAWSPSSRARPPPTAPTSPRACGSPASGAPGEVEAVDEESGETLVLRARHVACAAGVWTDRLRELAGGRSSRRIVPSKGIHVFVAARPHPDGDRGARADGEERAVRHPVAGRLADRRHRHAVGARPPTSPSPPAPTSTTCSRRRTRCSPSRSRRDDVHGVIVGPAAARRRGGAQRHDADQPPARRRVAGARPDDDRGRQVHDLPRDGRRPRRRGRPRAGTTAPSRDARRPAPRRGRLARALDRAALAARAGVPATRSTRWCAATATASRSSSR